MRRNAPRTDRTSPPPWPRHSAPTQAGRVRCSISLPDPATPASTGPASFGSSHPRQAPRSPSLTSASQPPYAAAQPCISSAASRPLPRPNTAPFLGSTPRVPVHSALLLFVPVASDPGSRPKAEGRLLHPEATIPCGQNRWRIRVSLRRADPPDPVEEPAILPHDSERLTEPAERLP